LVTDYTLSHDSGARVVDGLLACFNASQRLDPVVQVLYPTLSDYDIRYYVMEILKVRAATG